MGELIDPELEGRVSRRVDDLCRAFTASNYRKHCTEALDDLLTYFGGDWLPQILHDGSLSLRDLVLSMRDVYEGVERSMKQSTSETIALVKGLLGEYDMGFYPLKVALVAMRDILGAQNMPFVFKKLDLVPEEIPIVPDSFWELGPRGGQQRQHDPRLLFETVARMELSPELYDVGRQRKARPRKGQNGSMGQANTSYPTGLTRLLSKETGMSEATVLRLLIAADYEMPPEWEIPRFTPSSHNGPSVDMP